MYAHVTLIKNLLTYLLTYTCVVKSRYLEVVETFFNKFELPEVQINLHFG